jgi:hypothetical protein
MQQYKCNENDFLLGGATNPPGYGTSLKKRILFRGYSHEVLKSHAVCVCVCVCMCVCVWMCYDVLCSWHDTSHSENNFSALVATC